MTKHAAKPIPAAPILGLALAVTLAVASSSAQEPAPASPRFHDSHFHLTNYVQEGTEIEDFVAMLGSTIGRSTLFGIPLQQQWSHNNSGDWPPTYYLHTDAPLYYYSFTDAHIAMAYLSLPSEARARLDPMITGFNPADMYAADHIRRVLQTFPGVFSGIGEFTIHKEFVSSKIPGEVASLTNPALDRILEFAGEVGLAVLLHNDIDMPFAAPEAKPIYLEQMRDLLRRHPRTTIIWAHVGLGRVVHPVEAPASAEATRRSPRHMETIEAILADPAFSHVYFDISWDEVAKYVRSTPQATMRAAYILNRYPDRFLFGSDVVAPKSVDAMVAVYDLYAPLWDALRPEVREKVLKGNYERIFDEARRRVRAWEREHPE